MSRRVVRLLLVGAGAFIILLIGGRAAVRFYTDVLWYQSIGYPDVFWTRLGVELGVRLVAGILAAALVALNLWIVARRLGPIRLRRRYGDIEIAENIPRRHINGGLLVAALLGGWWLSALQFGGGGALDIMAWLRRSEWGSADPLFDHDLSFYVFSLPAYYQATNYLLLVALWSFALVVLGYVLAGAVRWQPKRIDIDESPRLHFVVLMAGIVLLLAARYWLGRYGLLLDGNGIGGGIGFTDVNARLPAHRALAVLSVLVAVGLLYGAWRRSWTPSLLALGALLLAIIGVGQIYPSLVQRFRVEPNEFAREAPFIRWNIEFTKTAYGLTALERRAFPYQPQAIPSWDELSPSLSQLPLWDPDQLNTAYNALQSLFPYYHFPRVEYDRYGPAGERRQVAVAVREFNPDGLTDAARTWQTLRLNPNYVRGMGAVVTPAAETRVQGEPAYWVRDLNPVVRDPSGPEALDLANPSVFFGQTMDEYVILIPGREGALQGSPGRDFPEGVALASFLRTFAFAWRFTDINMLFSGELGRDSRVVFRRSIDERLNELAPFVRWDQEAYPVISNGRITWIVDGYTVSSNFPLARPLQLDNGDVTRYMRNAVKATVDAVTGEVILYAADGDDPVLDTYRRIFPQLIQPLDAMPPDLREHLRYPSVYLRAQASILAQYHPDEPQRFYAGQDVWQLPGVGNGAQSYRPNYALMQLPGEERPEYLLSVPFIARERQNMTAVLIARNDSPHYGELQLLDLPRDQLVPGPGQVEVLIEQDPVISPQVSLWRRAGSEVQFGHLRILPLDSTFLYIKPLFLSAGTRAIPELRRVLVSDGRQVTMAPSLAEAFVALSGSPDEGAPSRPETPAQDPFAGMPGLEDWPQRALDLLEEAETQLRSGNWAAFGARIAELRELFTDVAGDGPVP